MLTWRTSFNVLRGVASRILAALMRVAKGWAAPGSGPKLISG
jgi:hypothetical protein